MSEKAPKISYQSRDGESHDVQIPWEGEHGRSPEQRAMDEATRGAIKEGTAYPTIEAALNDPHMADEMDRIIDKMSDEERAAFIAQLEKLKGALTSLGSKPITFSDFKDLTIKLAIPLTPVWTLVGLSEHGFIGAIIGAAGGTISAATLSAVINLDMWRGQKRYKKIENQKLGRMKERTERPQAEEN